MVPIDFQVTCSKVKVKPLFSAHCVVRSIYFDPFIWSIPNLVQGLPSISRWSLLIFWSHSQRSRSNHSFEPSVLSTLYIWIPCLLASDRFCFYREDKHEFFAMGGIYVSETFLVATNFISNWKRECTWIWWKFNFALWQVLKLTEINLIVLQKKKLKVCDVTNNDNNFRDRKRTYTSLRPCLAKTWPLGKANCIRSVFATRKSTS